MDETFAIRSLLLWFLFPSFQDLQLLLLLVLKTNGCRTGARFLTIFPNAHSSSLALSKHRPLAASSSGREGRGHRGEVGALPRSQDCPAGGSR